MGKLESLLHHRITRQAFATIAAAEAVKSPGDLNRLFRPAMYELGFTLFAGIEFVDPKGKPRMDVLFGQGFEPWMHRYVEMAYAEDDCMIQESVRASDSFFWSDVVRRGNLSVKAIQMLDDARSLGLNEGFVAPLQKSNASIFAVLLAGDGFDNGDSCKRASAHLLSLYYGMIGSQFHYASQPQLAPVHPLTRRQRQCLKWASRGKSSSDIGGILGISAGVVDEHIANACKRLGVRTRMQAVFAANLGGYLD
jgi:DNA-binding CsgD family transcriptional regulator